MVKISPSILSCDFAKLGAEVEEIRIAGAEMAHVDVMDGIFVPNMSFAFPIIESLRKVTPIFLDVHLMIKRPERYIDRFVKAGADIITVHYEACENPMSVIHLIHSYEMKAGLAISPKTPVEHLFPFIGHIDMALIMTVEPGFGGQALIPETLEKVSVLRKYVSERGISLDIEADGGINPSNVGLLTSAGANIVVAGSAIFKSKKPKQVIQDIKDAAAKNPFIG